MKQTSQPLPKVIRHLLLIILLVAFAAPSVFGFIEEGENYEDNYFSIAANFPMDWIESQIPHGSILLKLDISVFALFVVFIGGRSKSKWFNDRTIELVSSSISPYSKTVLFRAVFCFLSSDHYINQIRNQLTYVFSPRSP